MKNIVVAIEFDEELNDVIEFAADFLTDKKADVHIVHAYQSCSEVFNYAPHAVKAIESYEKDLQKQAETVNRMAGVLRDRGVNAHGYMKPIAKSIVASILEFAEEREAELIVVGTHHPKRLERMFIGSVTEELIRKSDTPVAVVPRKTLT